MNSKSRIITMLKNLGLNSLDFTGDVVIDNSPISMRIIAVTDTEYSLKVNLQVYYGFTCIKSELGINLANCNREIKNTLEYFKIQIIK